MRLPTFLIINTVATILVATGVYLGIAKIEGENHIPKVKLLAAGMVGGAQFIGSLELYLRSPLSKKNWDK
jgi:hypothetical protein